MNVVVCIKQVPSTETKVRINTQTRLLDTSEVEWVINPYDEYAIETALRIKEKLGNTVVTALTFGPERTRTALKTALSMGCDRAVYVSDSGVEDIDALSRAKILAAAVKREPFDIVLCGKQAVDDDLAFVPQALAHFLGVPHVAVVPEVEIEPGKGSIICHREVEGATEVVHMKLPCLVTIQKGKYEPRYPTLKLMMAAKKKEIPTLSLADLSLDQNKLTRGITYLEDQLPPGRKPGRRLEGEPADVVPELVRLLHEEAKVI
ncbi:MAG: electron transfer flavoprotein subunit beta/FixA family protein [candidate division WOR-3 bacterium]